MKKISIFSLYPEKATRVKLQYNSLKKSGFNVEIVTPKIPESMDRGFIGLLLRYMIFLFQMLFHKTDIIHFSNVPDYPAFGLLLRWRTKIVYDIRSIFSSNMFEMTKNNNISYLTKLLEFQLVRKADVVIGANRYISELARRLGAKKTVTLPNYPVKEVKKNYDLQTTKEKFKVNNEKTIFLMISTLTRQKPIDKLIISFEKITETRKVELWIVGDGKDRARLEELTDNENIRFFGYVNQLDLGEYISVSDVCLAIYSKQDRTHPKLYSIESVWKVGEYALYDKPIVAINMMPDQGIIHANFNNLEEKLIEALDSEMRVPIKTWSTSHKIITQLYQDLIIN